MENSRKRVNVKLVNDVKQLKELTASLSFDHFRIFKTEFVAVNMKKHSLFLNRPINVILAIPLLVRFHPLNHLALRLLWS